MNEGKNDVRNYVKIHPWDGMMPAECAALSSPLLNSKAVA